MRGGRINKIKFQLVAGFVQCWKKKTSYKTITTETEIKCQKKKKGDKILDSNIATAIV